MSATRPSRPSRERPGVTAPERSSAPLPRDISRLHARRREANRRRRLLRLDIGIGAFGAIVLLIMTPGLAIAALFAGLLLAGCAASMVIERRRGRPVDGSRSERRRPKRTQLAPSAAETPAPRPASDRGRSPRSG